MATVEVEFWDARHFTTGTRSAEGRCAQGGSGVCGERAEFTLIYRTGEKIASCEKHLVTFTRTTLNGGG